MELSFKICTLNIFLEAQRLQKEEGKCPGTAPPELLSRFGSHPQDKEGIIHFVSHLEQEHVALVNLLRFV